MNPHVSIIILNWNGWKDTLECLESVYQTSYHPFSVILVDNHSTDDSLDKIREYCTGKDDIFEDLNSKIIKNRATKAINILELKENDLENYSINLDKSDNFMGNIGILKDIGLAPDNLKDNSSLLKDIGLAPDNLILIKNNANHGFAGGNNRGMEFARDIIKSDYILLLNNDTLVDKDFLQPMVDMAQEHENIGFIGPKTYFYHSYPEKIIQITGGGDINLKKARTFQRGYKKEEDNQYNDPVQLGYVGGSCVLVKMETLTKIGLLDERFFMYWEDTDWSYRGTLQGYKSFYQPLSIIWHKHGASSKPCFELYYLSRNRVFFVRKNSTKKEYQRFLLYFFTRVFWPDIWYYLIHLKSGKKFKCYIKGLWDGFRLKI
ncbi:MAG: glycosyltransferase family 2 protein [Methanobacteriaceae archaeon]|nr:glycosyltransferase family 2 protein [Methanobacteriaceae archaeon]